MKLPIIKTVIVTSSVAIYFKKRKLYVDDKCYRIRVLPKKKVTIFRKDIVNIVSIIGSSTLIFTLAEKAYVLVQSEIGRREITFKFEISERLSPVDPVASLPESMDVDIILLPDSVVSVPDTNIDVLKPQRQFPVRDIFWFAAALAITYYLGQRIDYLNLEPLDNKPTTIETIETFELSWWDKLNMPDWMIKDLSNEGTYGQISRPTIRTNTEPISSPHPRRFLVILFSILQKSPDPTGENFRIPTWVYSPLLFLLQTAYKRFNK